MRASGVLQKCLPSSLGKMHALRKHVVLQAVDALLRSWRLTLMDMARAWSGAERVRAPLKALDRLLSNRHLHAERECLYANMARWLLRGPRPIIVVDWSDLKADKSWCLLRAAVPVGGRALTILDMVFSGKQQGSPAAERLLLKRLQAIVPAHCTPIVVTDAGFRNPWFRDVEAIGWYWVGRVRGATLFTRPGMTRKADAWLSCRSLHLLATTTPNDVGVVELARDHPLKARLVLYRKIVKGRKHRTRLGQIAQSGTSRKAAARESEPWLVAVSPGLALSPRQVIKFYARRMQIELAFRDLKSHRFGQAYEDSLTRNDRRIEILLLLSALATFACWAMGKAAEAADMTRWLAPHSAKRRLYSVMRLGREALSRPWPRAQMLSWIELLKSPPDELLQQMEICV